jgi:hypothetical protein
MTTDILKEAMLNSGYSLEKIEGALSNEASNLDTKNEYTKNLYILLWMSGTPKNITGIMAPIIRKVTKSDFTHSSWSIESNGQFHSLSMANGLFEALFKKNGAMVIEDLNALWHVSANDARYNVYKLPVTEIEYARAVKLWNSQLEMNFKYSGAEIIKMGVKMLFGKNPQELFDGFKDQNIFLQKLVCSTYVVSTICQAVPRLISWFRNNNFSTREITPENIQKIPGIKYIFSGNLVFEFMRWKELYTKQNGPLPN